MASTRPDNVTQGVSTVGGKNLSQRQGLDLNDLDVADTDIDPGSIGPNNPRPTRGPGQPFDIILS